MPLCYQSSTRPDCPLRPSRRRPVLLRLPNWPILVPDNKKRKRVSLVLNEKKNRPLGIAGVLEKRTLSYLTLYLVSLLLGLLVVTSLPF